MNLHILRRTLTSLSLKHEPLYLSHFSTLVPQTQELSSEITNYLVTRHNFSQKTASKTATSLTQLKDYRRSGLVIDFLKEIGISNTQLEELVSRHPRVLAADLEKRVRVLVKRIMDLGFSNDDLTNLLCDIPTILTITRSVDSIVLAISVLQSVLGSNSDVIKLLKACNWFLSCDLERFLLPNIELMESCGISNLQIRRTLFNFPRFFLLRPEFMRDCVRRVDEMGLGRESKMYIHGVRVVGAMSPEKWDSKLKLFKTLGFSEDNILSAFHRTPQAFAISERKILEVSKLFLSSESVDISYLVQHTELLIYSATRRVKPRLQIISVLMSKGLLRKEPKLTFIFKMPDEDFIRKFVLPYADQIGKVGEEYLVSTGFKAS